MYFVETVSILSLQKRFLEKNVEIYDGMFHRSPVKENTNHKDPKNTKKNRKRSFIVSISRCNYSGIHENVTLSVTNTTLPSKNQGEEGLFVIFAQSRCQNIIHFKWLGQTSHLYSRYMIVVNR